MNILNFYLVGCIIVLIVLLLFKKTAMKTIKEDLDFSDSNHDYIFALAVALATLLSWASVIALFTSKNQKQ
jgi:hypothetical protein